MRDGDSNSHAGFWAAMSAILLVLLVAAAIAGPRIAGILRPQHHVLPPIVVDIPAPVLISPSSNEGEKIDMPTPAPSPEAVDPTFELPPQHATVPEARDANADEANRHQDTGGGDADSSAIAPVGVQRPEVEGVVPRHTHRHAWRGLRHRHGRRAHDRAGCNADFGCPFLKDTARAAGLIE